MALCKVTVTSIDGKTSHMALGGGATLGDLMDDLGISPSTTQALVDGEVTDADTELWDGANVSFKTLKSTNG
jgi:sulfur carrier protein ThiS